MCNSKVFLCPECFEVFRVEKKTTYINKYNGKFFDKRSCMIKYINRQKKIKRLGLFNEEK